MQPGRAQQPLYKSAPTKKPATLDTPSRVRKPLAGAKSGKWNDPFYNVRQQPRVEEEEAAVEEETEEEELESEEELAEEVDLAEEGGLELKSKAISMYEQDAYPIRFEDVDEDESYPEPIEDTSEDDPYPEAMEDISEDGLPPSAAKETHEDIVASFAHESSAPYEQDIGLKQEGAEEVPERIEKEETQRKQAYGETIHQLRRRDSMVEQLDSITDAAEFVVRATPISKSSPLARTYRKQVVRRAADLSTGCTIWRSELPGHDVNVDKVFALLEQPHKGPVRFQDNMNPQANVTTAASSGSGEIIVALAKRALDTVQDGMGGIIEQFPTIEDPETSQGALRAAKNDATSFHTLASDAIGDLMDLCEPLSRMWSIKKRAGPEYEFQRRISDVKVRAQSFEPPRLPDRLQPGSTGQKVTVKGVTTSGASTPSSRVALLEPRLKPLPRKAPKLDERPESKLQHLPQSTLTGSSQGVPIPGPPKLVSFPSTKRSAQGSSPNLSSALTPEKIAPRKAPPKLQSNLNTEAKTTKPSTRLPQQQGELQLPQKLAIFRKSLTTQQPRNLLEVTPRSKPPKMLSRSHNKPIEQRKPPPKLQTLRPPNPRRKPPKLPPKPASKPLEQHLKPRRPPVAQISKSNPRKKLPKLSQRSYQAPAQLVKPSPARTTPQKNTGTQPQQEAPKLRLSCPQCLRESLYKLILKCPHCKVESALKDVEPRRKPPKLPPQSMDKESAKEKPRPSQTMARGGPGKPPSQLPPNLRLQCPHCAKQSQYNLTLKCPHCKIESHLTGEHETSLSLMKMVENRTPRQGIAVKR